MLKCLKWLDSLNKWCLSEVLMLGILAICPQLKFMTEFMLGSICKSLKYMTHMEDADYNCLNVEPGLEVGFFMLIIIPAVYLLTNKLLKSIVNFNNNVIEGKDEYEKYQLPFE